MRIQRPDGSERVVSGYKEKEHEGIGAFAPGSLRDDEVPPSVDLRPHLTAVEDQGDTNSCVANAVAGAYEYLTKQHTGRDYDVSRMFIYYNARRLDGDDVADEGTSIGDAIHSLKKWGACGEDTWPFDKGHVNEQPQDPAYDEAAHFIVEHTEKVPTDLDSWRHCLAEGRPIIFGLTLYNSFDRARKGKVPMPTDSETQRGKHGKHAMLAVGYSDADRVFVIRNSWGADWGDQGYCYIPYDYVMNDELNSGDSWVIRQLEGPTVDRSSWGDDSSILPTLDAEIHRMSDDDYQIMLEALGEVPLETRLALLYLAAAASDGTLSDAEGEAVGAEVYKILQQLGSDHDAVAVLTYALRHVADQELIEDSIALLGAHLSRGMLATLLQSMRTIAAVDGESEDEQSFIDLVTGTWEVGGADAPSADTAGDDSTADDDAGDDDDDDDEDDDDEDDDDDDDEEKP